MNFIVVKSLSPYNGIIGRPGLKAIQAVPSTVHGMLKFPTEGGIVTICSSLLVLAECASIGTSFGTPREKKNLDVFAWQPSDMTGVPRSVAEHRLNIREGCPPVRQKKRGQASERTKAIQSEVQKLVEARIMREVYYHNWLSNPVMRVMDKAFERQMGRNIKVYVDDLVVKSHTEAKMVRDIEETFQTLRKINMKLNPKKCSFGLAEGVFIGYVITPEGIKPCPDKTAAVLQLPSPQTVKEVQSLNGKLASLNRPMTSVKGQILADFLNEIPGNASQGVPVATTQEEPWTLFTDGSSCVDGSANKVLGTYVAKEDNMIKYLEIVKGLVSGFTTFSISQVPRSKNKKADTLRKIASTSFPHLSKQVLVEVLETKSIAGKKVTAVIEEDGPTWMTELVGYLKKCILPGDEKEARKLCLKARQYELMEGVLYKRSFLTPWLRCVGPLQAEYVIREIHEGSCSMHAGPRSIVAKVVRLRYYWLTMHRDARDMVRKCSDCQIHRPVTRHPQQPLTPITAPWPFYKWGIDIAGPFSEGPGKRLMDKAFESQMGRNIEVYVDDLVVKSHTEAEMVRDIEETFRTLRKINMKLNPKKCSFGLAEGVFLGYVITPEGIKPCPDKIAAVLQLPSPQTVKEVQSLNGKLASLNRFLSKLAEKSLPLFQILKKCIKKSDFRWTAKAKQAFQQLKQHLSDLHLLVAPRPQEELIMYLSATHGAISAVLMTERGTAQMPIYFISRALQGPELNYPPMEKLVLSLVFAAKRLRRYFQAHPITVITDQPIKQVMSRPDVAGRLQKWSIMLGEHNITYRPRTLVKGQILANFLNEMSGNASQGVPVAMTQEEPWTLFTDGSSCVDGSGAWLILTNPEGVEFTYALRFQFAASNNKAEYKALVAGLRITTQIEVKNVQVNVDSKLVANQVLGTYVAKEDNMIKYLEIVKDLVIGFTTFSISQVSRSKNKKADALSKIESTSFPHLSKRVLVKVIETKSITGKEVTAVIEEEGPTWMTELVDYLKKGILPGDKKEARKLRLKAQYVMREIHEGSCSMHAGPRSVVAKAVRLGYYWPTMHRDVQDMIRKCSDCQIHCPVTRHPQQPLTPITAPWPFYKWGIDIAGPFPEEPGKVKFLIVAMDYFTKWIEAKAVATITGGQVKKFAWDNIVCRFGIPGGIISYNGKQFADNPFKDWCDKLNITQRFASVKHPQSNGLVERANRSLREGIKACLGEGNMNLVEELPHVLWAHRTMIKSSHGDTPFSLTYGTESIIPAEIGMLTYRTAAVDLVNNDEELRLNLDLLEERWELAAVSEAKSKSKMMKYYNARVRGMAFKPGDFVYRSNDASHAIAGGKLRPK
nr:reverse transcriptase domain-containing protein [Tanacetum cinerariifolium]